MYPYISKNIIYFPITRLRGENVKKHLNEIQALEKTGYENILNIQIDKIKILLQYVYNKIPYYKIKMNEINMLPHNFQNINDFNLIPIMTKIIIRDNISTLKNNILRQSLRATSGTTGEPLVFFKDRLATSHMEAIMHYAYSWHGIGICDRQARLWGRPVKRKDQFMQQIKDLLLNRRRLSAFHMTESACIKFYKDINNQRPCFMYGYANAIYQFAKTLESNNIKTDSKYLKAIICTGEILFKHKREFIENYFGIKVMNEYGSTENGIIGFECEYNKMHAMPTLYVEIPKYDQDGFGKILITELNSRSIPFIRYEIGDRGRIIKGNCSCGRPYPILEVHEGRIDDYIKCPDGRLVYDAIFAYILKDVASQFRVFQENINDIRIVVVPNSKFTKENKNYIINKLYKHLDPKMNIIFEEVTQIKPDPSGKYRYFISKL